MKERTTKTIIYSAILLLIMALALLSAIFKVVKYNGESHIMAFVDESTVNDILDKRTITFTENDDTFEIEYSELGLFVTIANYNDIKNNIVIDCNNEIVVCDREKLDTELAKLNNDRKETEYPQIIIEDNNLNITNEVTGNILNIEEISNYIQSNKDNKSIKVDLTQYYVARDSDKPNEENLKSVISTVDKVEVSYTNEYTIRLKDLVQYLEIENNEIKIPTYENSDNTINLKADIQDKLSSILEYYQKTGNEVDIAKETEYIYNKFKDFTYEEYRIPIFSKEVDKNLNDTYLKISIEKQHIWHYINGELHCDTDVVTGVCDNRHETPVGTFHIIEKVDGKYLRPQGVTEPIWVDKWMRLTWDGIGLHDAQWREDWEFGGETYIENGSHGCINLPKQFAYDLFDDVDMGTLVIIY